MYPTRPPSTPEAKNGFSEGRDKGNAWREKKQELSLKCRKIKHAYMYGNEKNS